MKELSIEEKAKAYDKALERARIWKEKSGMPKDKQGILDNIFPELKESEDERTRKGIIRNLEYLADRAEGFVKDELKERIAWLEKQGEQKEYTFKSLPRLLDMIEPTSKAKAYCQKLIDTLINEGYAIDAKIVGECLKQMNREKVALATMDKKQSEQTPTDKIEPKFHEGDWITNGDYTWKIVEVKPLDYILQSQDGNIVDDTISHVDEQFHSFTIEDAKDGNVLTTYTGRPFIFKGCLDERHLNSPVAYCGVNYDNCFFVSSGISWWTDENVHPATKEQRDLLFQKMKESGYEWNVDKKELKKIEKQGEHKPATKLELDENGEPILTPFEAELFSMMSDAWQGYLLGEEVNIAEIVKEHSVELLERANEQKAAWCEEDEDRLKSCLNIIQAKDTMGIITETINTKWLKSLKERVQSKHEWSEEDERNIQDIDSVLFYDKSLPEDTCMRLRNWLESLRPQNTWRPSDEQLDALHNAAVYVMFPYPKGILMKLYKQLKKLRGE